LLRDYSLQGCFATALSLRLLRNGPLSKVALRPLSLGCSVTALLRDHPGLLRDHSLILGCFATTLLSWVASRPLFCPGLLRDRSLLLGCFATTLLSWVASRPLSCPGLLRDRSLILRCLATALSSSLSCPGLLCDRSLVLVRDPLSKLHASQLRSYIYPVTTQTTPTLSGPASLAPCFEAIYSLSWPLSSMIGLLPRWARTIVVNNFNSRSAGPAKFNTEILYRPRFL
jgi:hypothetical protein